MAHLVRSLALSSGDPGFKPRSDYALVEFVPGSSWFNFPAALVHSQLVCLQPVGILNMLFIVNCVSLALKSP